MSNSAVHKNNSPTDRRLLIKLSGALLGLSLSGASIAAGQVDSIFTSRSPATPFTYTVDGIEYQWGMGTNEFMEGFTTTDGEIYDYASSADRVDVLRDDILGVTTGEPCGIFVERIQETENSLTFAADYPSDGSGTGNCDLSALLTSRIVNRGAVDLFSNNLPDAKNIERLDYIYNFGVLTPFLDSDLALAGHAVAEKSSNNPVKVAAILELDVLGRPAAYGPMVLVGEHFCFDNPICYNVTDLEHTYSFLQNNFNEPQSFPVETERSRERVGMAFVSVTELGLGRGQRYYGLSFFSDDVNAEEHNLLDPSTFPNDTSDDNVVPGDDADIYGGLSGFFLEDAVTVASGSVFNDTNLDGVPGDTEAGISDISITLYSDVNGNGLIDEGVDLPLGDSIDSDMSGNFVLPGVPDGNFLVVMDANDPDLPPGLISAPGTNPFPLTVSSADIDNVFFPFVNADGTEGGASDGGTTGGLLDGATGGSSDGVTDGATGGSTDGASDGATGGSTDGVTDGAADGSGDGSDDGATGGSTDGLGNGDSGLGDGGDPIQDSATRANADQFEINQGEDGLFDVLANDIDGAGQGLTIVSVSDSSNASIEIANNEISYRPNFGFHGTDTFLYVMEDADGTQLTGNVSVNVIRFSDLNGNLVNDFVECNCTNLLLETGVHGSGIGRVSFLGSLALLLTVWIRRRSRLKPMSGLDIAMERQ